VLKKGVIVPQVLLMHKIIHHENILEHLYCIVKDVKTFSKLYAIQRPVKNVPTIQSIARV